jgi:hypothetical protein
MDPLPSNGRPIVACVRFAGMCLQSRYLAMGVTVTIIMYTSVINYIQNVIHDYSLKDNYISEGITGEYRCRDS